MGALYGILGGAGRGEIEALDRQLAHRGREGAHWSPGRDLVLGIRSTRPLIETQEHGPVAFDGALDNRREVGRLLGRRDAQVLGPGDDPQLLVELVDTLGLEALAELAGTFALALWFGPDRRLVLARDRIGYAPLYFTLVGERLIFASEYKALLAIPDVPAVPNRSAIQTIHSTKWVQPGVTCLEGIHPVAPGSWLEIQARRLWSRRFWNLPIRVAEGDESAHAVRLRESFLDVLRRQTAPYARIGISLSGGLDSAVVAAGVRAVAAGREVHTFSAGYGPDDRELVNAARVAQELGTHHHPVVLDPADLPALLPWMVWHLEEPIGREDISYLFVAAREAARHVDVVLAGFGFDGLFAGLPRHRLADLGIRYASLRGVLGEFYDYTYRSVPPRSLAGRLLKAAYFRGRDFPAPQVLGAEPLTPFAGFPAGGDQPLGNFLRRGFMVLPYQSPVERLYAAAGVRMNAQHTDPAFLAAAFSIPDRLKIRGLTQKYILRKACQGLLPPGMLGFGKSFNRLKHDVRLAEVLDGMSAELLSPAAVRDRGLFDPDYVARLLRRSSGRSYPRERVYRIWSLLLTEIWGRTFLDRRGTAPHAPPPPVRRLAGREAGAGSVAAGVPARAPAATE